MKWLIKYLKCLNIPCCLGAQYYIGNFGFGLNYGFRPEKASLSFTDASAGEWSPSYSNDKPIKLDLGGSYLTILIMIRFMKRYADD